jgi:hypothetical protein
VLLPSRSMINVIYVTAMAFSTQVFGYNTDVEVSNSYAKHMISDLRHDNSVALPVADIMSAAYASSEFDKALLDVKSRLDDVAASSAVIAIEDAKQLLNLIALKYQPWVDVTEDGIAIIQWRVEKGGLALLFGGDKSVTVSERTIETNYVDSSTDYDLSATTGAVISASLRSLHG